MAPACNAVLVALRAGNRPDCKSMRFYYTYVLKSDKDKNLYVGWTNDLKERINAHLRGKTKSTKSRLPLRLVYYEACLDRAGAIKREKQLKTGFGRSYLKRRIC